MKKIIFIVFMSIICSISNAASNAITINSKDFKHESYSRVFHRPYCPTLMSQPAPMSYFECRKLGLRPCKKCISEKMRQSLESAYLKAIKLSKKNNEGKNYKKKNTKLLQIKSDSGLKSEYMQLAKRSKMLKEKRRRKEELAAKAKREKYMQLAKRSKMLKEKRRRNEELAAKAKIVALVQHERDIAAIKNRLSQMKFMPIFDNTSGFSIPHSEFYINKRIVGDTSARIDFGKIGYNYTVCCLDSRIIYDVIKERDYFPFHLSSESFVARPTIEIKGKKFNETEKQVEFSDHNLQLVVNKLNFKGTLEIALQIINKTTNYQEIKDINIIIGGIACRLYSISPFTLMEPLSLPPKSSYKGFYIALPRDESNSLPSKLFPLKQVLTLDELPGNTLHIALSAKYCRDGHWKNSYPFFDDKKISYADLFR